MCKVPENNKSTQNRAANGAMIKTKEEREDLKMVFYSKEKGIYFSENISNISAFNKAVYISVPGENTMHKIKVFDTMMEANQYIAELASTIGRYENPNTVIDMDTLKSIF